MSKIGKNDFLQNVNPIDSNLKYVYKPDKTVTLGTNFVPFVDKPKKISISDFHTNYAQNLKDYANEHDLSIWQARKIYKQ